jgi:hypothetical protein
MTEQPINRYTQHFVLSDFQRGLDSYRDDSIKKQCPMGGCPDDKKLNKDIYDDMMVHTAEKKNLDLTDPQQKKVAHMDILPLFRQRVRENRKYIPQDKEGPAVAPGPDFEITPEGIYYPQFHKTLWQMREDQKRIRPESVDHQVEVTLDLLEAAFAGGATRVKHVSHNKDTQGNDAIRDEITMIFDPKTGKGRMEIRNIALDGNFHSIEGALRIMRRDSTQMVELHPEQGIGIFADKPMSSKQLSSTLSVRSVPISEQVMTDTMDTVVSVGGRLREDVGEAFVAAKNYIGDSIERRIVIPPFLQKLINPSDKQKIFLDSSPVSFELISKLDIPRELNAHLTEKEIIQTWKECVEQAMRISPDQSEELLSQIQEKEEKMHDAEKIISFIVESDVTIGAAVLALDSLAKMDFDMKPPNVQETITQTAKEIVVEKDGVSVVCVKSIEKLIDATRQLSEKHQLLHPDELIILTQFVELLENKKPEEAIILIEKEQKATGEKIQNISTHIRNIVEIITKPESGEEENHDIDRFSFALDFWMILKYFSYLDSLESMKNSILSAQKKDVVKTTEYLAQIISKREPTPWLLFAIIWYLVMIRESCVAGSRSAGQVADDSTIQITPLLQTQPISRMPIEQHAVIFAACS